MHGGKGLTPLQVMQSAYSKHSLRAIGMSKINIMIFLEKLTRYLANCQRLQSLVIKPIMIQVRVGLVTRV